MSNTNDHLEIGFGDSMRELHGNVTQAINVVRTRLGNQTEGRISDAQTLRRLEEVNNLFEAHLKTVGEFCDDWQKFADFLKAFYKAQRKRNERIFLVTSGGEALAIAASTDPINGVLDPVGMAAKS
jgi:hypothetical protein